MEDQGDEKIARRSLLGLFAMAAAMLIAGCGLVKSYAPFRYRLTVEVDTPQGLRTGSSVIEVTAGEVRASFGGAGVQVRGEALAVNLPGGETLFALLRGDSGIYPFAERIMFDVSPRPRSQTDEQKGWGPTLEAVRANRKVNVVPRMRRGYIDADPPFSAYPMLVRFRDFRDPKTVELVDPDNLAISFGPSVTLRRITVQLTNDPVTAGIDKRLAWLPDHRGQLVSATKDDPEDARKLSNVTEGDFSLGIF